MAGADNVMILLLLVTLFVGLPMMLPALFLVFDYPTKNADKARSVSGYFCGIGFGIMLAAFTIPATSSSLIIAFVGLLLIYVPGLILSVVVKKCPTKTFAHVIVAAGVPSYIIHSLMIIAALCISTGGITIEAYDILSIAGTIALVVTLIVPLVIGYFLRNKAVDSTSTFFLLSTIGWGAAGLFVPIALYIMILMAGHTSSAIIASVSTLFAPLLLAGLGYLTQKKKLEVLRIQEGAALSTPDAYSYSATPAKAQAVALV